MRPKTTKHHLILYSSMRVGGLIKLLEPEENKVNPNLLINFENLHGRLAYESESSIHDIIATMNLQTGEVDYPNEAFRLEAMRFMTKTFFLGRTAEMLRSKLLDSLCNLLTLTNTYQWVKHGDLKRFNKLFSAIEWSLTGAIHKNIDNPYKISSIGGM